MRGPRESAQKPTPQRIRRKCFLVSFWGLCSQIQHCYSFKSRDSTSISLNIHCADCQNELLHPHGMYQSHTCPPLRNCAHARPLSAAPTRPGISSGSYRPNQCEEPAVTIKAPLLCLIMSSAAGQKRLDRDINSRDVVGRLYKSPSAWQTRQTFTALPTFQFAICQLGVQTALRPSALAQRPSGREALSQCCSVFSLFSIGLMMEPLI